MYNTMIHNYFSTLSIMRPLVALLSAIRRISFSARRTALRLSALSLFFLLLPNTAWGETQYWFVNATLSNSSLTAGMNNAQTQWLTTSNAATLSTTSLVSISSSPNVGSIYYNSASIIETDIEDGSNWSSSSSSSRCIRGFKFANGTTYTLKLGAITANKIRLIGWCGGTSKTLTIGTKSCTSSSTKNTFEVYTFKDNFIGDVNIVCSGDFYGILIVSEASGYTISYNTNGGTAVSEGSGMALPNPLPTTTKEGYDFAGWYTDEKLTKPATAGATISDNTTLYAKWTPTTYDITYEGLEGATNSVNNPATYTIESETITFVAPGERAGYDFAGWSPASIAKGSTGNKTVTAQWTIAETPYTFSYGEKDQSYATLDFTRVGTTNEWRITDFVFPDVNTNQACYVGKGGSWYNDALGTANAKSADLYFYDMPLALLQNTSCGAKTLGWEMGSSNGHKAIGTLRIFDNYSDDNLYVGFIPNGYGLMHGAEGGAWSGLAFAPTDANGTVWTTDPVTLTAEMFAGTYKYYVGLLTSDDGYTYCGNSETSVLNTMGSNANGVWGDNLGTFTAGQKGVFRIWANSCNGNNTKNFVCHFLPYYHLTYNANYPAGAGGQPADTQSADYSAESSNTITLPDAPAAPTGYTFKGWYDAATAGNLVGDAGADYAFNQPTANITLYAQWEVRPTYTVTYVLGADATGATPTETTKYEGEKFTLASKGDITKTGFVFKGWNDGTTTYDAGALYTMPAANVTLTAQWEAASGGCATYLLNIKDVVKDGSTNEYKVAGVGAVGKNKAFSSTISTSDGSCTCDGSYTKYFGTGSSLFAFQTYNDITGFTIYGSGTGNNRTFVKLEKGTSTSDYTDTGLTSSEVTDKFETSGQCDSMHIDIGAAAGSYFAITLSGNINVYAIKFENCPTLPACETPSISTQPADGDYCAVADITELKVVASVSDGGTLLYQWKKDGADIDGANSATYTPTGEGTYTCVVTNTLADHTSASTTSNEAVITINAATAITTQPTDQTVVQGESATLTVAAKGAGTLTYQWYTCQSDGSSPQTISGATAATYTVTPDALGTIYYKVIVTGDCGTATSDVVSITASKECGELIRATLTGAKTADVIGILAGSAEVSVSNSDGKNEGYKLGSNNNYIGVSLKSGYTFKENDTVVINVTTASSYLRIYSDKGTTLLVESSSVTTGENRLVLPAKAEEVSTLYLYRTNSDMNPYVSYMAVRRECCPEKKPVLTAADNTTLCGTGNVVFKATNFTAGATLNLYQVGNATPLQTVSTTDKTSVTFTAVSVSTTAKYYAVASNDCDKSSDTVTVTVNTLPTTASLVDPVGSTIYVGDSRTFEVTTDGEGCTYQWLRDGVAISGATGKTYKFTAEMSDVNTYSIFSCRVTGCDGTTKVTTPEVDVTVQLDNCYYITENKTLSATKGYDFGDFVLYIANKNNNYETSTSNICAPATKRYYASSVVIELKTVGVSAIRLFGQHTANRSVSKVEVSDALNGTYTEVPTSEYTKVDYTYSSGTPCGELGISDKNFLAGDFVRLTFDNEFRISGLCVTGLNCSTLDMSYSFTEVEVAWADRETPNLLPPLVISTAGDFPVTYSSSNEKVATVDADGVVSLIGVGTANIIASFEGNEDYCPKNAVYSVTVTCSDDVPQIAVGSTVDLANCNDEILLKLQDSHGVDIFSGNIQWYRNGVVLPGATAPTYTATVAGTYTATLTNTCEQLTSNSAEVTSSVPQPIVTPVVPKRFFQISNRSVRPYTATTHYPLFDVTPKATAAYTGAKWVASYTIHAANTGIITAGTAAINWLREDASTATTISIGANYKDLGSWLTANHPSAVVGDTLMLTMKTINSCDEWDDASADSIAIVLTDKYSLAYIVTGNTTTRKFLDITAGDINTNLYKSLCNLYDVTPVSAYATYKYENYEPFDLLLLTDYPKATGNNNQKDYVDALADLVDKKPILSLKAHMSALSQWSAKGFTSNPVVPGDGSAAQAQKTLTVLCFSHDMFTGADWDNVDLRTLTILDNVYKDGSAYKGIQGFTALNTSEFMNIATVYDAKGSRNIVACCERQKVVDARFIMLSINQGATQYINTKGSQAIDKLLEYLLATDASQLSDCSVTFDNGAGGTRTVTVDDKTYTSGNKQWSNPANWNSGKIPTQLQNVRIEANCIVSGNTYGAGNIRIKEGNTLTIAPNGGLASVGKFGVYAGTNWNQPQPITNTGYITVQANADSTGMLMHSHTDALAATVQMYSPAYYDGGGVTDGQERMWTYVGIPVQEGTVPCIFNGAYTYLWDETSGWVRYNDGKTFQAFNGIALSQPSAQIFTFAGNLALAKKYEFTLTNTKGSTMQGMNLIGNSWTAPIQITKMEASDFGAGLEATVYIHSTGQDPAGGPSYTTNGTVQAGYWTAVPIESAKTSGWTGPKIIPAMQAFEVNFGVDSTQATATLTLDYNTIVRAGGVDYTTLNQKLYKPRREAELLNPDPTTPAPYDPSMLRIRVADTAYHADLHLLQAVRFAAGFDNGWDGYYMGSEGLSPGLFTLTPDGEMQVSAQPELEGTVVGFTPGKSNTYTFSFILSAGNDGDEPGVLYLNDMQLRRSTVIDEVHTYTFQTAEGDMTNRFVISATPFEEGQTPTGLAELTTIDGTLTLSNPAREPLTITVYDPAGKLCSQYTTADSMVDIAVPDQQGAYMISVRGEQSHLVRKIIR